MSDISYEQYQVMVLIKRSQKGSGWAYVSTRLTQYLVSNEIEHVMGEAPDKIMPSRSLIDFEILDDGTARARLTNKGLKALSKATASYRVLDRTWQKQVTAEAHKNRPENPHPRQVSKR